MSVVEIKLTADQLAALTRNLNAQERRSFLAAVFEHPAQQQARWEIARRRARVSEKKVLSATTTTARRLCGRKMLKASCAR